MECRISGTRKLQILFESTSSAAPSPGGDKAPKAAVRNRLLGQLPYLSLVLFLIAIAALVWLTRQYDSDEQKAT